MHYNPFEEGGLEEDDEGEGPTAQPPTPSPSTTGPPAVYCGCGAPLAVDEGEAVRILRALAARFGWELALAEDDAPTPATPKFSAEGGV